MFHINSLKISPDRQIYCKMKIVHIQLATTSINCSTLSRYSVSLIFHPMVNLRTRARTHRERGEGGGVRERETERKREREGGREGRSEGARETRERG